MLQTIAMFIFSTLVQLLSWQTERETIKTKLQPYFDGASISENYVTRYQVVGLVFKSATMTILCMVIYAAFWVYQAKMN
jgi:hypothetical protein